MKLALVAASLLFLPAAVASAQQPADPAPIQDNSFLIEEAYNEEAGIVQHIFEFTRNIDAPGWTFSFTQEWAAGSRRHQLSYTVPVQSLGDDADGGGLGNVAFNYRYQLIGSGNAAVAFAPRFSVLFPTGSSRVGAVEGTIGLQGNLPLSIQPSRNVALHTNAGATVFHDAKGDGGARATIRSYNLGQSLVWLAAPRFNVLVEAMWTGSESVAGRGRTENSDSVFVNPGVRWAYNLRGGLQIVPGVSFPIGVGPSRGENSVLFYLSFEHPYRKAG